MTSESDEFIIILKCKSAIPGGVESTYRVAVADSYELSNLYFDSYISEYTSSIDPYQLTDLYKSCTPFYRLEDFLRKLLELYEEHPLAKVIEVQSNIPYLDIPSWVK